MNYKNQIFHCALPAQDQTLQKKKNKSKCLGQAWYVAQELVETKTKLQDSKYLTITHEALTNMKVDVAPCLLDVWVCNCLLKCSL